MPAGDGGKLEGGHFAGADESAHAGHGGGIRKFVESGNGAKSESSNWEIKDYTPSDQQFADLINESCRETEIFMLFPIKPPARIEWQILKWVAVPVFALLFLSMLLSVAIDRHKCSRLCEEKGFYTFSFSPGGRSSPKSCYCVTAQEHDYAKSHKRLPQGVKVF